MAQKYTLEQHNVNNLDISLTIEKRAKYYANVIVWTLLYALPLFVAFDILFLREHWVDLLLIRVIATFGSYVIYLLAQKLNWHSVHLQKWFLSLHVLVHVLIACFVPQKAMMSYFIIASLVLLLISAIVFWETIHTMHLVLLSFVLIGVVFALKTRMDKYDLLVSNGGAVFFLLSILACGITYNRWQIFNKQLVLGSVGAPIPVAQQAGNVETKIVEKEVIKTVVETKVVEHNPLIDNIEDYRKNTTNIRNSLLSFRTSGFNLTAEQKQQLENIHTANEKLYLLTEKLVGNKNTTQANALDLGSTVQEAKQTNTLEPVVDEQAETNLNAAIEAISQDINNWAVDKNISLQLNLSYEKVLVKADPQFLRQVLTNLFKAVVNCASHSSILSINTINSDKQSFLEINNYGLPYGIEKLKSLFEANTQDYSADMDKGFAKCAADLKKIKSTITYNSEEYKGNFYRVEFNSNH